ncbi:MAG: winged helix-turn-helix domain-containing protein [Candidatus Aenigmatarchaeota archaeon]
MDDIQKVLRVSDFEAEALRGKPSVFFIITPDRSKPHFFLHYAISKEIASLSNAGATVKVLILDNCAKILDSEIQERDVEVLMQRMKEIISLVGGSIENISFLLGSALIDEKRITSSVLKLLSSLSIEEIQKMMRKTDYGLGNGFFDAAAIASLPEDQIADYVVVGEHENIAEYLIKNKLGQLTNRSVKVMHARSLYTVREGRVFPYGIANETLFISDSRLVLADKVSKVTESDLRTAIRPFLTNFVDDWMAENFLSEKGYAEWKRIDKCGLEKTKNVFLEYIYNFSQSLRSSGKRESNIVSITNLESKGSSTIFAALSNEMRIDILLELERRPLSLSELFVAVKKRSKNEKLTAAHVFPHLRKLMDVGLVRKENEKYEVAFHNLSLFIR